MLIRSKRLVFTCAPGWYGTVIEAVTELNIPILCVSAVGIVLGILLISKIIDILLKKAYTVTYSMILGLVAASIISVLNNKSAYTAGVSASHTALGAALSAVGFSISYTIGN